MSYIHNGIPNKGVFYSYITYVTSTLANLLLIAKSENS